MGIGASTFIPTGIAKMEAAFALFVCVGHCRFPRVTHIRSFNGPASIAKCLLGLTTE
jgi:hypothetical protein